MRKKRKYVKADRFAKKIKKVYNKTKATLRKL